MNSKRKEQMLDIIRYLMNVEVKKITQRKRRDIKSFVLKLCLYVMQKKYAKYMFAIEDGNEKLEAKIRLNHLRELCKVAHEVPTSMSLCNYYGFILDNWNVVEEWSVTYLLLYILCSISKCSMTETEEEHFSQMIKEWKDAQ